MPWTIVRLKNQLFGIACEDMREILRLPEVDQVPDVPAYVRGVINLRNRVIPMVDLRRRLSWPSATEEVDAFCELLQRREQDHRNWLKELESSVAERRAFTLATDPHKCAFGRWYDSYRADNAWIGGLLKRFDRPHQQIHAVAVEVEKLKANQEFERAFAKIAETRDGRLGELLKLFAELKELVRNENRETAIVLERAGRTLAITVDEAQSIEKFSPDMIEEISPAVPMARDGLVRRLARTAKGVVLLIETDGIVG